MAMFSQFPLCRVFAALILFSVFAHADTGTEQTAMLSPDQIVQLLKDSAKPFDNVKIVSELSGRHVMPPVLYSRHRLDYIEESRPEIEITFEARRTLMMRGTEITFERENISYKSSREGAGLGKSSKWSNVGGVVKDLSVNSESVMTIDSLDGFSGNGVTSTNIILLSIGVGIGRFIESIESIQHEPNGEMTARGTVSLFGFKSPCIMQLNKDYFPLHISIVVSRNPFLRETLDIHIGEVSQVDGHWYGKTGTLVFKEEQTAMRNPAYRYKIFDDYAYNVSEIKLSFSDEEYEQFTSMPITLEMQVNHRIPEPKKMLPHLPDLPPVGF